MNSTRATELTRHMKKSLIRGDSERPMVKPRQMHTHEGFDGENIRHFKITSVVPRFFDELCKLRHGSF